MTPQQQQQLSQALQNLSGRIDAAHAMARNMRQEMSAQIAKAIADSKQGRIAGMRDVDNIPGKRVPFDLSVSIPVAADSPGPYSQTGYVTPDGYFVAVYRYATFLSEYTFQVTSEGNQTAQFQGRSNGRYRPVHSMCDLMDAQGGWNRPVGAADPGDGTWQLEHTTNRAGFRTMQFDGLIEVVARDADYRRQNNPVPTALWAPGFTAIHKLPVPDVFRPGTSIDFNLQANHTNNPAAGHIQSVFGSLPYLDGQFDGHEGIGYSAAVQAGTDDAVTRRPDGVFVCGYFGYRILTPDATVG